MHSGPHAPWHCPRGISCCSGALPALRSRVLPGRDQIHVVLAQALGVKPVDIWGFWCLCSSCLPFPVLLPARLPIQALTGCFFRLCAKRLTLFILLFLIRNRRGRGFLGIRSAWLDIVPGTHLGHDDAAGGRGGLSLWRYANLKRSFASAASF